MLSFKSGGSSPQQYKTTIVNSNIMFSSIFFISDCLNISPFFVVSSSKIRNICPVPTFATSNELSLPTENAISHVKYDPENNLVYWIANKNIYRGLSDERYTSDNSCFTRLVLANGKLKDPSPIFSTFFPSFEDFGITRKLIFFS